jgi:polyvinyl alcohol dehydrogenase (cytochrome)
VALRQSIDYSISNNRPPGTGDSYSEPAAPTSDAIMAIDLDSGAIKWVSQLTSGDAWNLACGGVDSANCPASNGPDFDFGSPPMLVTLPSGEPRLVVGQKSGVVHSLDAANGKVLWSTRVGKGGVLAASAISSGVSHASIRVRSSGSAPPSRRICT